MIYKCKHHGIWKGVINKTWNMEKNTSSWKSVNIKCEKYKTDKV